MYERKFFKSTNKSCFYYIAKIAKLIYDDEKY
jgi:hypothetical protein